MVITAFNENYVFDTICNKEKFNKIKKEFFKKTDSENIRLYHSFKHPRFAKVEAEKLMKDTENSWIVFDTAVLDYVDLDKVIIIDKEGKAITAEDFAKENRLIGLYPGEIVFNKMEIVEEDEK